MKTVITLLTTFLLSNNLIANDFHKSLGITVAKLAPIKISPIKKVKDYTKPVKSINQNRQIKELLSYTKVKVLNNKKTCCGLKMGYKLSKNLSLSVNIMAEVDIKRSSNILKSKEANIGFALSI